MAVHDYHDAMPKLTQAEVLEFLAEPRICRLGCVDYEGFLLVVPCDYLFEGGAFYVMPRARALWGEGPLAVTSAGLSRAERASLRWTHNRACASHAHGFPRSFIALLSVLPCPTPRSLPVRTPPSA
jgi:hypothetical protein